jgi:hypothetical protein
MRESVGASTLDFRSHFRILVSSRPSLSCLLPGYAKTPSNFDGVFWVNQPSHGGDGLV